MLEQFCVLPGVVITRISTGVLTLCTFPQGDKCRLKQYKYSITHRFKQYKVLWA